MCPGSVIPGQPPREHRLGARAIGRDAQKLDAPRDGRTRIAMVGGGGSLLSGDGERFIHARGPH